MVLRKGDLGFNDPEKERAFPRRAESSWPTSRTEYTKYYLTQQHTLSTQAPIVDHATKLSYEAPNNLENPKMLTFSTPPVEAETFMTISKPF